MSIQRFVSGQSIIDICIQPGTYLRAQLPDNPGFYSNTFQIAVNGNTDIYNIPNRINSFFDRVNNGELGVWFHMANRDEYQRRCYLVGQATVSPNDPAKTYNNNWLGFFDIAFTSMDWEQPSSITETISSVSLNGGYGNIPQAFSVSNVTARLAEAKIQPTSTATKLDRAWLGFKSGVDSTNFKPVIGATTYQTSGITVGKNVSVHSTNRAINNVCTKIGFTPDDTALEYRFTHRLGYWNSTTAPGGARLSSYPGRYRLLMRWVSEKSDTQVIVQVFAGLAGQNDTGSEPTWLKSEGKTSAGVFPWHIAQVASIEIPANEKIFFYDLAIKAQRISGTGALFIDQFFLVPEERSIFVYKGGANATLNIPIIINQYASNSVTAAAWSGVDTQSPAARDPYYTAMIEDVSENYGMPPTGVYVCVADSSGGVDLAKTAVANLTFEVVPRYPLIPAVHAGRGIHTVMAEKPQFFAYEPRHNFRSFTEQKSSGFAGNFTDGVEHCWMSKSVEHGHSQLVIELRPNGTTLTRRGLENWMQQRLMYTIQMRHRGVVVWEGIIWEMELTLDAFQRVRTMEGMYNKVKRFYTDYDGDEEETDWITEPDSISRFGEHWIAIEDKYNITADGARRETEIFLALNAHAPEVGQTMDQNADDLLVVTCYGYWKMGEKTFVEPAQGFYEEGDIGCICLSDCGSGQRWMVTAWQYAAKYRRRHALLAHTAGCINAICQRVGFSCKISQPGQAVTILCWRMNWGRHLNGRNYGR